MQTTSKIESAAYSMNMISLEDALAESIIAEMGKRVIITINGTQLHSAITPSKEFGYHILLGKGSLQKILAEQGDEVQVTFAKDTTDYQMDVCEEFLEVLYTDPDAQIIFESLTPGRKRSLIHHTNKAKRSETRINRALKIMDKLKLGYRDLKEIMR